MVFFKGILSLLLDFIVFLNESLTDWVLYYWTKSVKIG